MNKSDKLTLNTVHLLMEFNEDHSDLLIPKNRFLINMIANDNPNIVINMNGTVVMKANSAVVDMVELPTLTLSKVFFNPENST